MTAEDAEVLQALPNRSAECDYDRRSAQGDVEEAESEPGDRQSLANDNDPADNHRLVDGLSRDHRVTDVRCLCLQTARTTNRMGTYDRATRSLA
jgi:hypothetical protein